MDEDEGREALEDVGLDPDASDIIGQKVKFGGELTLRILLRRNIICA